MISDLLLKLLLTAAIVVGIALIAALIRSVASRALGDRPAGGRRRFWTTQVIHIATLAAIALTVVELWAPDQGSFGAALAWLGAGVAVALQRVITAFAGYLILLRGKVFTIGDRITIGGVRGDVVNLGFMQTTVMEMGQTPAEQKDEPSMWIRGRQYSGRIVRVTNDKIFDTPVYNYTRGFPFMWEEIVIPVAYGDDWRRIERIMHDAAATHTRDIVDEARPRMPEVERTYFLVESPQLEPKVYVRMTDNYVELAVRYLARSRHNRDLSDAINRDILTSMEREGLEVGSTTLAISGLPPVRLEASGAPPAARSPSPPPAS